MDIKKDQKDEQITGLQLNIPRKYVLALKLLDEALRLLATISKEPISQISN